MSTRRTTNGNVMQITEGKGVCLRTDDGWLLSSSFHCVKISCIYKHAHYVHWSLLPGSPQWWLFGRIAHLHVTFALIHDLILSTLHLGSFNPSIYDHIRCHSHQAMGGSFFLYVFHQGECEKSSQKDESCGQTQNLLVINIWPVHHHEAK